MPAYCFSFYTDVINMLIPPPLWSCVLHFCHKRRNTNVG